MEVYHSGNFWGHHRKGEKALKKLTLNKAFEWEKLTGFIPAIYTGEDGIVIDLCIRIPMEEVSVFMEKWRQKAEEGAWTDEETEQLIKENPFTLDFLLDVTVNGEKLQQSGGCGSCWNPLVPEQRADMERKEVLLEEELADTYGCDKSCGWCFVRKAYDWPDTERRYERNAKGEIEEIKNEGKEITEMHTVTLHFQAERTAFPAELFATEIRNGNYMLSTGDGRRVSVDGKPNEIRLKNPYTGKEILLTIHSCKQEEIETKNRKDIEFPTHFQELSYSTSPELTGTEFRIQDCAKGDAAAQITHPEEKEKKSAVISAVGSTDGPTATFLAGKIRTVPDQKSACSSLYFDAVSKVEWKPVFYEKEKTDLFVTIEL